MVKMVCPAKIWSVDRYAKVNDSTERKDKGHPKEKEPSKVNDLTERKNQEHPKEEEPLKEDDSSAERETTLITEDRAKHPTSTPDETEIATGSTMERPREVTKSSSQKSADEIPKEIVIDGRTTDIVRPEDQVNDVVMVPATATPEFTENSDQPGQEITSQQERAEQTLKTDGMPLFTP